MGSIDRTGVSLEATLEDAWKAALGKLERLGGAADTHQGSGRAHPVLEAGRKRPGVSCSWAPITSWDTGVSQ